MKYILSVFAFLVIQTYSQGQDTIKTTTGVKIIAKVFEIDKDNIKYKKLNNPDGPAYLISVNEVESVNYQNGDIDLFAKKAIADSISNKLSDEELFSLITKKHNKVFIQCDEENATIHAINAINAWGYWIVTEEKEKADFILKFNIVFAGLGDHFGKASFIAPQTGKILKTTKEVNTIMSWDMNTKRGVIDKIVNKEIKAMYIKK
jgi:hypothetical protein